MSDYYIPGDLHRHILKLLPAKHLFHLRLVCKDWGSIIQELVFPASFFIRTPTGKLYTLSLQSLDDSTSSSEFEIPEEETQEEKLLKVTHVKNVVRSDLKRVPEFPVSSCHGLILIPSKLVRKAWAIWNPFNGRSVHSVPPYDPVMLMLLPSFNEFAQKEPRAVLLKSATAFFGIGYDDSTSDYKVVRIARLFGRKLKGRYLFRTLIYSLKSQAWRRIDQDFPCDELSLNPCVRSLLSLRGVFTKGALHWVVDDSKMNSIVTFDLSTETFDTLPLPHRGRGRKLLDVQGGHLFFSSNGPFERSVWILKDYGGEIKNKWSQLVSLTTKQDRNWTKKPMRPVSYVKSKEQVIVHYDWNKLMWIDVEKKECLNKVTVKCFEDGGFTCQQLPASLAWVNGKCGDTDESSPLNRRTSVCKRKRTVDVKLEISVCKRPKCWTDEHTVCNGLFMLADCIDEQIASACLS